jgi:thiamine-monophosphate kinase
MQDLGEFEIIDRYFSEIGRRSDVVLGVGDDAAVLDVGPSDHLVAAVDTLVAGVHFPEDLDPADIGWRALAVNLSDLAAMGARPAWATLSLSLPRSDARWLAGFAAGFARLARIWDVALVGGDTVRGPLVVTVQVLGLVERDRCLTRAGAAPGDLVLVSGTPGDAAAGLDAWQRGATATAEDRWLIERFTRPLPRIELGRQLRLLASAAMDVSDGLIADLGKLCAASDCAAEIHVDRLPLSDALAALEPAQQRRRYALAGGDDYELVFTMPPETHAAALADDGFAVECTPIGRIRAGRGVQCLEAGVPVDPPAGWDHFRTATGAA